MSQGQELTITGMGGRSAATLTAKGKVKLRLDAVGWLECREVLHIWQAQVSQHTGEFDPLDPHSVRWWQRLGLLMGLIGVDGQLETLDNRTGAGAVPQEVTLTLTKLEAVTLLELSWALPPRLAQYSVWMGALGEVHQLLS